MGADAEGGSRVRVTQASGDDVNRNDVGEQQRRGVQMPQVILQARDAGLGQLFRIRRGIRPTSYPILPVTAGTPAS